MDLIKLLIWAALIGVVAFGLYYLIQASRQAAAEAVKPEPSAPNDEIILGTVVELTPIAMNSAMPTVLQEVSIPIAKVADPVKQKSRNYKRRKKQANITPVTTVVVPVSVPVAAAPVASPRKKRKKKIAPVTPQ